MSADASDHHRGDADLLVVFILNGIVATFLEHVAVLVLDGNAVGDRFAGIDLVHVLDLRGTDAGNVLCLLFTAAAAGPDHKTVLAV